MTNPTRTVRGVTLLAVLALALTLLVGLPAATGTSTASAALSVSVTRTDGDGVSARNAPRNDARTGYGAPEGARVTAQCWGWGDTGPRSSRLWWTVVYQGRTFWVNDWYLTTPNRVNEPPAGQPQCGGGGGGGGGGAHPLVWVGSPVNGTWSRYEGASTHHCMVNAQAANGGQPGDWCVDVAVGAGAPVKLFVAPDAGGVEVTTKVDAVGAACGGGRDGASFVTVGFYVGGTRVGSASYGHLRPVVRQGDVVPRWGTVLGHVAGGLPVDERCWTGSHVHYEQFSTKGYACFNRGYAAGSVLRETNFLGFSGPGKATRRGQPCP